LSFLTSRCLSATYQVWVERALLLRYLSECHWWCGRETVVVAVVVCGALGLVLMAGGLWMLVDRRFAWPFHLKTLEPPAARRWAGGCAVLVGAALGISPICFDRMSESSNLVWGLPVSICMSAATVCAVLGLLLWVGAPRSPLRQRVYLALLLGASGCVPIVLGAVGLPLDNGHGDPALLFGDVPSMVAGVTILIVAVRVLRGSSRGMVR
jgi:hypothetical protein